MKTYLKIAVVGLCSLVIAVVASRFVQPPSSEALKEYEQKYQEISSRHDVTDADKKELEILFRRINSAHVIKADLIDFTIKYSILFVTLIPLAIYTAKRIELEEGPMFVTSGLIFMVFIFSGLLVVGAILGSIFFVASVTYKRRREATTKG